MKSIKQWRTYDNLSKKDLEKLQQDKLSKQLSYAYENISVYSELDLDFNQPIEKVLQNFPILTKEELRTRPELYLVKNNEKFKKIFSSGSTGVSTWVAMNIRDLTSVQALLFHLWELMGYNIGEPILQMGISPNRTLLKKLKDIFFNTYYVSAFVLDEIQLRKICDKLSRKKNYTVIGYPSSLNIISEFALKQGYNIKINSVIGLGDKLFPSYRENIEKAFGCKIHETYGSSEGFQMGFQVDLEYMYQYSPQVYLELLDDDNLPVKDGEIGNVVVTRLDNTQMPLIRYKLGDLAIRLPEKEYPLKRKFEFPILKEVVGRNTDVVKLPDGRKLVVHSFTGVFEYVKEIKQFKIIQKDTDGILIEFIPSKSFINDDVLEVVAQKLQKFIMDDSFKIKFIKVDKIGLSKSGKSQIIESKIN